MQPLAIMTMVYDDDAYLSLWLRYWTRFLPRENLFVVIHDRYEHYAAMVEGCNILRMYRPEPSPRFEMDRFAMLSGIVSGLTHQFQRVMYTDVDEIVALDPAHGDNLVGAILESAAPVVAPFGVDLVHVPDLEREPLDLTRPVLGQRSFFAVNSLYSKPCITSGPISWSGGGHWSNREDVRVSRRLVLFHLRMFDFDLFASRNAARHAMARDEEGNNLMSNIGWGRLDPDGTFLATYTVGSEQPADNIITPRQARKMEALDAPNRRGHRLRRWRHESRTVNRIPDRFVGLF